MQPWLQAMQRLIVSVWPARAFSGQSGSARNMRPFATKSALPVCSTSSASSGERILPTAITGMPTFSFTRWAKGISGPSGIAIGWIR